LTAVLEHPANLVATVQPAVDLMALPEISVIMPAYNEEGKIADCIQGARAHLERLGRPYEIIVVDDGSTDATRREARRAGINPHVRVVGYSQNRGKGFALKHGVKHAKGDLVVFMDSDADAKPDRIEQYIAILKNNDMAIASKRHPDSRFKGPILRKFLSVGFHVLVMLLTGVTVSDTQSGFKAFRREALVKIIDSICVKRYAFDVELLAVASLLKMRIVELPIKIQLGSLFSARQVVRMLVDLLGITYRLRVIHWYQKNLYNARATYKPIAGMKI
jgi:glycosyltransferase involved in cell wall biosynthesis